MDWTPIRKVGAAFLTAVAVESTALTLFITGVMGWREFVGLTIAAVAPPIVAYLVPAAPMPSEGGEFAHDPELRD